MRVLLDTHIFLWLQLDVERIGPQLEILEDPETDLLVSAASSWEIAVKFAAGKLPLPDAPESYVPRRLRAIDAYPLSVEHSDALSVSTLPRLHGDPFDRLLIAQAKRHGLPLVTADRTLTGYPIETILI